MSRWFRVYDDLVDDPKVQLLSADSFRVLINLWCLSSQNDGLLPSIKHIAFKNHMRTDRAERIIFELREHGLIDKIEQGLTPHNWDGRQFKSDVSTDRVKRFRKRQGNVSDGVTVTPPETETETETETEREEKNNLTVVPKEAEVPSSKPLSKNRGTRLPDDFEPDARCWALAEKLLMTAQQSQFVFENFRDFFHAAPGQKGVKLDWNKTFCVWLRNQKGFGNGTNSSGHKPNSIAGGIETIKSAIDRELAAAEARERDDGENSETIPRLHQSHA